MSKYLLFGKSSVGSPDIFLIGIYETYPRHSFPKAVPNKLVLYIVFNVSSRDIRHFDPDPGFNENVENHAFPRFGHFVRRNGPDPGATKMQNVFPVISVQSFLYQLPYGAFCFSGTGFPNLFSKIILAL